MRTSCIILTLACLLALPSFANEIPLILEETIQLPEATPYWDVMPHWNHSYCWVSAFANNDSNTEVFWGLTSSESQDSFLTGHIGEPTYISAFFDSVYSPCVVINMRRVYGYDWEWTDTSTVSIIRLSDASDITPPRTWTGFGWDNMNASLVEGKHRIMDCIPSPSPPQATSKLCAVISKNYESYRSNSGAVSSDSGWVVENLLTSGPLSIGPVVMLSRTANTLWANNSILITWGIRSRENYPTPYTDYRMDIIAWDVSGEPEITFELPTITWGAPSNGPNPGFLRTRTCALSTDSQSPLAATDWGDNSLSAINMMSGDFDWQVENSQGLYEQLLMAYILIDESSEQILAYDSDRQLFDIIKIEDGSIWGQTSELSNDYDEMKIIGRYHNDYRRLAVRYDDEIQIYSFGEPIIVAADASPSLPSDYNFTIYPNPFNPTATISFSLPVYEQVKLSIYNTLGQQVALLTNEQFGPGNHTITFDAADLPSGIYFAHLTAGSVQSTKKLVLLK